MTLDGSGNLVITGGFTSGSELEVSSSAPTFILNANTQATNKKKIRLAASQFTAGDFNIQQMNDDGTTIALTAMTIKNGGNVGIGTTNPGAKLSVYNGGISITSPSGSGGQYFSLSLIHI